MERIDLKDWTLLSKRAASENYISNDQNWMLKFYHSLKPEEMDVIKNEQAVSKAVLELGIPTPEVGALVQVNEGYGVLYENIKNKVSLSRGISKDPSLMPEYIKKFCKLGKILHSTECDTSRFPSAEESFITCVQKIEGVYTDAEKQKIYKLIENTPKTTTCLHGDFHPGNFITGEQGDFVIDLGLFSYGNPVYDWAQWWFMVHGLPDFAVNDVFHTDRENVLKWWDASLEYYFGETGKAAEKRTEEIGKYGSFVAIRFLGLMPKVDQILIGLKNCTSLYKD